MTVGCTSEHQYFSYGDDKSSRGYADGETAKASQWAYSESGAGDRSRTYDLLITNELLYQLSYTGMGREW